MFHFRSLSLLTLLHTSRIILLLVMRITYYYELLRLLDSSMFSASNVACNFSPIKSKLFVQEHGLSRTSRKDKHPSLTDDSQYKDINIKTTV